MNKLTILGLILMAVSVPSHAATAWKTGEVKDADGDVVCIYKNGLDKIYQKPDFGTICPMTIEVSND